MSLTDRAQSILITSTAILDGEWHWLDETPGLSADGWDTLTVRYVKHSATFITAESARADFDIGDKMDSRNFWVQGLSGPKCLAGGLLHEITVTYQGYASEHPAVITINGAANQQTAENVTVTEDMTPTLYTSVATQQPTPTLSYKYIIADYEDAPTDDVGSETGLPGSITLDTPDNVWDYVTSYVYNFPNGWVLMTCQVNVLPGTTVAMVTQNYQYIHAIEPA